jgi:hypothetical protein
MANPVTKGSFRSEEEMKEGGLRMTYVIYLIGYIWAVTWTLLIIY